MVSWPFSRAIGRVVRTVVFSSLFFTPRFPHRRLKAKAFLAHPPSKVARARTGETFVRSFPPSPLFSRSLFLRFRPSLFVRV